MPGAVYSHSDGLYIITVRIKQKQNLINNSDNEELDTDGHTDFPRPLIVRMENQNTSNMHIRYTGQFTLSKLLSSKHAHTKLKVKKLMPRSKGSATSSGMCHLILIIISAFLVRRIPL